MPKKLSERSMYEHVRYFLFEKKGCSEALIDIKDEKNKRVKLSVNGAHYRIPDIVAKNSDYIYFAEGKFIKNGNAFDDALSQIISLKPYGHFFYIFCPKADWEKIDLKKCGYDNRLKNEGVGLILLDEKNRCDERIYPILNDLQNKEKLQELDKYFCSDSILIPQIDQLSSHSAVTASRVLAGLSIVSESILEPIIKKIFKKIQKIDELRNFYHFGEHKIGMINTITPDISSEKVIYNNKICIVLDPFGFYKRDYRPCIWIFFLSPNYSKLNKIISDKQFSRFCHVNIHDDNESEIFLLTDDFLVDTSIVKNFSKAQIWFGHCLECFGRSFKSIAIEFENALKNSIHLSNI